MGNGEHGTYTEVVVETKVAIAELRRDVKSLEAGQARAEKAAERSQAVVTDALEAFGAKLDTITAGQTICKERHDDADRDRERLWDWTKRQWGMTGLSTIIGAVFGFANK